MGSLSYSALKPAWAPWLLLLSATVLAACAGNEPPVGTIATIEFETRPGYGSEQEIMALVEKLQILLDSPDGFAGLDPERPFAEGFELRDPDGDGQNELWLQIDQGLTEVFPRLGFAPGHNQDAQIAVRVLGLDAQGLVVAYGGTEPQQIFVVGKQTKIVVPLLLAREFRPPHVVAVLPQEALPVAADLGAIAFVVSKPLRPASVDETNVRLVAISAQGDETVVPGRLLGPHTCPFGTEMWQIWSDQCVEAASLRLELTAGIQDPEGRALAGTQIQALQFTIPFSFSLGPCNSLIKCTTSQLIAVDNITWQCDSDSGLVIPAPCAISVRCEDEGDTFAWLDTAADDLACRLYRSDSYHYQGNCIIEDPWPCRLGYNDCPAGSRCELPDYFCSPVPCSDQCSDPDLLCTEEGDCLPRLGGCQDDCTAYGACPGFDQECVPLDGGGKACRKAN